MQPTTWTDELRAKVTLLWVSHSAAEISSILWEKDRVHKSRNAVIGLLHRLKLTSSDKLEVHPSSNNAHKPRQIAPRTGKISRRFEPRCIEVEPQHVNVIELSGCAFPYGGYVGPGIPETPITFCNHPKLNGSSYCGPHNAIVWVKPIKTWAAA